MTKVYSWGRLSHADHPVLAIADRHQAAEILQSTPESGLAYGMGRSYGDVCLNPGGTLWMTQSLDRFIDFDDATGQLSCEAGMLLRDIQQLMIPRGWILPVTPGTQLITVGGAIANDVHGKSHHSQGTFANHVKRLTLLRTDGEIIECGPNQRSDWFEATVGGIGLTGLILTAEIQLQRVAGPWLTTQTIPYRNLSEFFQLERDSASNWEHTVSWIDCLSPAGRGLFMRGNYSPATTGSAFKKRSKTLPVTPPFSLINSLSLKAFNTFYYQLGRHQQGERLTHYEPFFYPLDNVNEWNRIYGPKGFFQYQCVIPHDNAQAALSSLLTTIAKSADASFLAVLKTFGNQKSLGMLSFPQPGVTLALDFPNKGSRTETLFKSLDAIVSEAGGRLYLAKDARMPKELFMAGYPQLDQFLSFRDPGITSAMSRRLLDN